MPAPIGTYNTDRFIYTLTNLVSPTLCFVDPNLVSVFSFLMVFPILHNFHNGRPSYELVVLSIIKQFLDCLDGSIARNCNKSTAFGAKLDIVMDILSFLVLSVYVLWCISKQSSCTSTYLKGIFVLVVSMAFMSSFTKVLFRKLEQERNDKDMDDININSMEQLFHDNSVLVFVIGVLIYKNLL